MPEPLICECGLEIDYPSMDATEEQAKAAYEAYWRHRGQSGESWPIISSLSKDEWREVAQAVLDRV